MLLPLLIPITIALLFIIFYKRPLNSSAAAGWNHVPIDPPAKPAQPPGEPAVPAAPVAPPAPVSMNFNDVFAPKAPPSNDRPSA